MLYLVNCTIVKNYYQDDNKEVVMNHIVEAENEQQAMGKIEEYYSKKDEEYYLTHWVNFNYCNEVIC